jgi:probable HAF family extracellular repeat protein
MNKLAVIALAGVALCAGAAQAAQTKYVLKDLGHLPGDAGGTAYSINASGNIAGVSEGTADRPFLYSNGVMHDLSGFMPSGTVSTEAFNINNSGLIVGYAYNGVNPRAFSLTSGGVYTDLGTLGGSASVANQSNSSGVTVGWSTLPGDTVDDGVIWNNGQKTDLPGFGGFTTAKGINDSGVVAGYSFLPSGFAHSFVYSNGHMTDIGTMGGANGQAAAINNLGQIAGDSDVTGNVAHHGFIYLNGHYTDLGSINGGLNYFVNSINNLGDVVGEGDNPLSGANFESGFLYHNGVMVDLNNLITNANGLFLTFASWINDHGQIVGTAIDANGVGHAVLLDPLAAPEPATWAMMIAGLASVGAALRHSRRTKSVTA